MCTLIVLHRCFPEAPLVAAANRDEFHARPASGPRLRRFGARRVLAPRDEHAGGTWLGLSETGLFAALTNLPCASPDPARRSRGQLVADVLGGPARASAAALALGALPAAHYNPFNLFLADERDAFVVTYETAPRVAKLAPGAHVIGNAAPDARTHPKCGRLLAAAEKLAAGAFSAALPGLTALCRAHDGDGADPRSDTCIHMGDYGTRSSALLQLGARAVDAGVARFWFAEGAPCARAYEDFSPQLVELLRRET